MNYYDVDLNIDDERGPVVRVKIGSEEIAVLLADQTAVLTRANGSQVRIPVWVSRLEFLRGLQTIAEETPL